MRIGHRLPDVTVGIRPRGFLVPFAPASIPQAPVHPVPVSVRQLVPYGTLTHRQHLTGGITICCQLEDRQHTDTGALLPVMDVDHCN